MRQTLKELFTAFFKAKDNFLWKEDIRQDIIFDDDASNGAVRELILEARKWLAKKQPSYEILTIWGRGYCLVKTGKQRAVPESALFCEYEKEQRKVLCADAKKKTERGEVRTGGCADWL